MTKFISTIIIIGIFFLSSCKKKLPEPGATASSKVANEWWVTLDSVGIPDYYSIGHFKLATYNTATNDNTIWIDDLKGGWGVKFKSTVDYNNLTFTAQSSTNAYYDPTANFTAATVNQTDGKIFSKLGHSKAGNVVDSIHMKVEFSDDPGTMYEINGVERTRLIEDDY